ncbi:AAA family ATPase [uncultured Clostridium sp.]|uniref:AAA family ATPase n=1 Tax=uncultured Clostridium sp. TaxID=59620 RepID=UPI0026092EA0|nr:AAA family ATPase [uncultured Clostridium sp.]
MREVFIGNINVREHERLGNINIDVVRKDVKHIIITGKNGTGKTTLLDAIWTVLTSLKLKEYRNIVNLSKDIDKCNDELKFIRDEEILTENSKGNINKLKNRIEYYMLKRKKFCNGIDIKVFNDEELEKKFDIGEFICDYYKSRRIIDIEKKEGKTDINNFIDYLYQLKDREEEAIAIDDEEEKILIQKWFNMFERLLEVIWLDKDLKFYYHEEIADYVIEEKNKQPYTLYELSDGQSAAVKFFIEIMGKMEKCRTNKYDVEGIILIDELEKHIHPELQMKLLSMLSEFFPNVQFIITTMSPFILNSMEDCLICDLDKL